MKLKQTRLIKIAFVLFASLVFLAIKSKAIFKSIIRRSGGPPPFSKPSKTDPVGGLMPRVS